MRTLGLLLSVLLFGGIGFGETLQGIQVGDLDLQANPCTDFYEYANGAWRANNPIPASMDRWSRRWAAGESNKEKVKAILEDAAAKTDQPKGSITQLTGDFYAACMDMTTIDKLGVKPLEPSIAEVDAIEDRAELVRMIGRMEAVGIGVPFRLRPLADPHNPSEVIADIRASGLGLPDRGYYLKPEERFQRAREEYLAHVTKMFQLRAIPMRTRRRPPYRLCNSRLRSPRSR